MGWVEDCLVGSACYNTTKTGSNLVTGLVINFLIGILCYVGFVLWRGRFKIYYARLVLPQVRLKPAPLRLGGHWQLWSWLLPVFQVRDAELLKSAGLDALMALRVMRFGIMLFTPLTVLGVGIILPVNYTGNYYIEMGKEWAAEYNSTDTTTSTFMRMTISNIPNQSHLYWIHFTFLYIFVAWACHLLLQYSKEYIALRQVYAVQGVREACKGLPSSKLLKTRGARIARRFTDKHTNLPPEHSLAVAGPEHSFASSLGSNGLAGGGDARAEQQQQQEEGPQALGIHRESATKQDGAAGPSVAAVVPACAAGGAAEAAAGPEHSKGSSSALSRLLSSALSDIASLKRRVAGLGRRGHAAAGSGGGEQGGSGVEARHKSSALSWGDAAPEGRLAVEAEFKREREEEEEEAEEEEEERTLYPGRYTVLVLDEVLQRFKLRHEKTRGFLRTALPSLKLRQIDPESEEAQLDESYVEDKAWKRKPMSQGSKRLKAWANHHYRMNTAGSTFTTVFGEDFGGIIPIYPTKAVDNAQQAWFFADARRERLALQLSKLLEQRQAVLLLMGDAVRSNPLFAREASAGANGFTGQQQKGQGVQEEPDLEGGAAASAAGVGLHTVNGGAAPAALGEGAAAGANAAQGPDLKYPSPQEPPQHALQEAPQHAQQQQPGGKDGEEQALPQAAPGPRELARLHTREHQLQRQVEKLQKRLAQAEEHAEAAREAAEAKRKEVLEGVPCPSFFVTFRSQKAAILASQTNLNPLQERLFQVMPAPEPGNVNWPTLQRGWWERNLRPGPVLVAIVVVMLFPIGGFTGIGSQLQVTLCPPTGSGNGLDASDTWFCSSDKWATLFRNVVTSWLPAVLLSVYQAVVLPVFFYTCAQAESFHYSLSSLDKRCGTLFFYWNVFNFFLGALLGGSVASAIQAVIQGSAKSFINLLGAAIPGASVFFISYVSFQFLAMVPFRLFWPHVQVLFYILKWLHILPWAKTPKDLELETPPRNCRFSRDVGINTMAVAIVSLAYAVITPLILPFALLYFLTMWAVWRYQLLYVWQPGYDAQGEIWTYASHCYAGCLILMSVFSAAMLAVKGGYVVALIILFTLVPFLIWFNRLLIERYDKAVVQLPLVTTVNTPEMSIDPTLYAPPPLRDDGRGWHLDWGKAWQYWGVPRYGI